MRQRFQSIPIRVALQLYFFPSSDHHKFRRRYIYMYITIKLYYQINTNQSFRSNPEKIIQNFLFQRTKKNQGIYEI